MAKLNCAVCDREVGYMGQINLADGKFICKYCANKAISYFEPERCTLQQYYENLKQNEIGQRLYEAYFHKNGTLIKLCDNRILYDPGTALICIVGEQGAILDRKKYYNVFMLADLVKYESVNRFVRTVKGANEQVTCLLLSFENVSEGISSYRVETDENAIKKPIKVLDRALAGLPVDAFGHINRIKAFFHISNKKMQANEATANKVKNSNDYREKLRKIAKAAIDEVCE